MTKAWTSMPLACASLMISASGSKPAAIGTRSASGSSEFRYHESARRRVCTKIALQFASFALLITVRTSLWLLSAVLKVSTQKPRYCSMLCAQMKNERHTTTSEDKKMAGFISIPKMWRYAFNWTRGNMNDLNFTDSAGYGKL